MQTSLAPEVEHIHTRTHTLCLTQVGAMPARAMGSTVASVAAAEVALHQQTVDDFAATDDFKWRLQPLLDGEAVLEDRDGAIRQMMNVFTTTATAMNDAGASLSARRPTP